MKCQSFGARNRDHNQSCSFSQSSRQSSSSTTHACFSVPVSPSFQMSTFLDPLFIKHGDSNASIHGIRESYNSRKFSLHFQGCFARTDILSTILLFYSIIVSCDNSTEIRRIETLPGETCVTKYERVETIVHDTVYQHSCASYHVSQCNVTHVPTIRDSVETRCVPSYETSCKKVDKNVMRKECRREYKAECFQVLVQVMI